MISVPHLVKLKRGTFRLLNLEVQTQQTLNV